MRLNYQVEWELEDDVIDSIVDRIEEIVNQYPDCDEDDCIYETTENFLDNSGIDECDHFNIDCYFDEVVEEVKKRYFDRKQKSTVSPLL